MLNFKEKYNNLKRLKIILSVLGKYGLEYFFDLPEVEKHFNIGKKIFKYNKKNDNYKNVSLEKRARLCLEELGPTFVKMGQILSTRPDLISQEFIKELSKLQDSVVPFDFEVAKEIVEKELNGPIDKYFKSFNKTPVASASLSQVHKAKLKSGEVVAVKIQRPKIKRTIISDLAILSDLARFVEKRNVNGRTIDPVEIVNEVSDSLQKEMDFVREGRNIDKFKFNFKDDDYIHIPEVYWKLSTSRLLVMEFIPGIKVSKLYSKEDPEYDNKLIAARGADIIFKQIFEDGFFHADPHPGNLFIMKNNVIAMLDCGMVGRIDQQTMNGIASFLVAVIRRDSEKVIKALEIMDVIDPGKGSSSLRLEIDDLLDKYYDISLGQLKLGEMIDEIFSLIAAHQMKIPGNLTLLTKALITIEGVGEQLDPEFNVVEHVKPFAERMIKEKYSPKNIFNRSKNSMEDLVDIFELLPNDTANFLKNIRKNGLNIGFEHKGLEKVIKEIDRSSNQLSISLVIAALIVGSSIIMTQEVGPFIYGHSAIGLLGFGIASFFGLFLVVSIFRSGRWK